MAVIPHGDALRDGFMLEGSHQAPLHKTTEAVIVFLYHAKDGEEYADASRTDFRRYLGLIGW